MKKVLLLAIALFALGAIPNVMAEEEDTFERIGQTYPPLQVTGMKVGSTTFTVKTEPNWHVVPYINGIKQTYPGEREVKIIDPTNHQVTRSYQISGWRSDNWGKYTVQLDSALKNSDTVSLRIADDGNFFLGRAIYRSNNELRKEREAEQKLTEQKLAEEAYLKYIEYDNNQPWHKRVGDSIQGHLANFKGWLRG
ncbi:hypothetical protein [Streptococcus porcinus]|uniref:Phage protein n=1 Tax=Streptococcus porcinus TaxID=1340 RepID=A0A7V9WQV4_STRPO|nr:hypothetical protein [Streptococcus porcinus]MBA2795431.1 hypothetical protein [Streptococcus porcinus]